MVQRGYAAHPSTTNYSRLLVFFRPRAEKPRQPAKAIIENFHSVYSQYKYVIFRLEKMCVAQRGIAEEYEYKNKLPFDFEQMRPFPKPRGFLMIAMIPIHTAKLHFNATVNNAWKKREREIPEKSCLCVELVAEELP